ncbi:MAG: hypothetical protein WA584_10700 [Pyrinomonadaceae bacterium]
MAEKIESSLRARLALEEADSDTARQAASELAKEGFTVTHVGQRGVGFEGNSELFNKVFKSEPQKTDTGFTFESEPQLPEGIADLKANVYFPTRPEFFDKSSKKGGFS